MVFLIHKYFDVWVLFVLSCEPQLTDKLTKNFVYYTYSRTQLYFVLSSTVRIQLHVSVVLWAIFRFRLNLQISYTRCGGRLGGWGGGWEGDLVVSIVGTVTPGCYKWIFSSCLCIYVKWATILMLRVCYSWYHY